MSDTDLEPMTAADLAAEGGTALPAKEVMSLLDLNANVDLGLDAAAPIDLAVGANANVAAPISAAVGANVASPLSEVSGGVAQQAEVHQGITGDATANAPQTSSIDQSQPDTPTTGATDPTGADTTSAAASTPTTGDPSSVLNGDPLLNVNVNVPIDAHLAAPVDGAVAAQANADLPVAGAVSANVLSDGSTAHMVDNQSTLVDQTIVGNASATGDQTSTITQ